MPRRTNPPTYRGGRVVALPPPLPPPSPPPPPPREGTLPMGPLPPEQYRRTGNETRFGPTPSPPPPPPRVFDPQRPGKQARVRTAESNNSLPPLDPAIREMGLARMGVFEPPPIPADTPKPVSRIVREGNAGYVRGQQAIHRNLMANPPPRPSEGVFDQAVRTVRNVFRNPPRLHGAGNPNRRRQD